jgi:hypothetical protein
MLDDSEGLAIPQRKEFGQGTMHLLTLMLVEFYRHGCDPEGG